jgi:hypothetical protein
MYTRRWANYFGGKGIVSYSDLSLSFPYVISQVFHCPRENKWRAQNRMFPTFIMSGFVLAYSTDISLTQWLFPGHLLLLLLLLHHHRMGGRSNRWG